MDLVINAPRNVKTPQPDPVPRDVVLVLLRRYLTRLLHRGADVLSKARVSRVGFLLVAALIGLLFVLTTLYAPSYVVTVNGQELGTVWEKSQFEGYQASVEQRASDILGRDYTLEVDVDYTFQLTKKDAGTSGTVFTNFLFDQVGEVLKSYVLTVNGQVMGAAVDRADVDELLERVAAPYCTENTISYSFADQVEITWEYTSADLISDPDAVYEQLTANTSGETTYTVVAGDTFNAIAYANDMSSTELKELNPEVEPDKLSIGQVLTIRKTVPFLSVTTVDTLTYEEEIPCPVEEQEDSSMYVGDTRVITEGIPGLASVTADVTYLNGYEESREITDYQVLSEATTQVVAVGTKERPRTMPTGTYIWPCSGRLSSTFGTRTLLGVTRAHKGIDIATSYGTAISAADGGTVTFSGWNSGGYGYLVIIDHGNGIQTYYGHCSSLLVSAGDKVYQGQTIARVGSTGRSTGNHCHFEIRIGGTAVNPLSYLP